MGSALSRPIQIFRATFAVCAKREDSTAVPQGCSKTKDEKRQEPGRTKGQGLMGG